MNYRHHYHAGNFADVMKHAVLVQLVRALQRKDKGFLYLDTHAGRASYDLAAARHGDTLERKPEHPDGIGRLVALAPTAPDKSAQGRVRETLGNDDKNPSALKGRDNAPVVCGAPSGRDLSYQGFPGSRGLDPGLTSGTPLACRPFPAPANASAALANYLRLVRDFDRRSGNLDAGSIRFYPGSPTLARALMRPQDRMALCEMHPDEFQSLRNEFKNHKAHPNVSLHEMDGYTALRAMLPAPEKRALVLIDPPYETQNEYEKITQSLRDALRRMSAATYAVWYPLTQRARASEFLDALAMLNPPPTLAVELAVAGETEPTAPKMRGCGLAIINPPWQIDQTLKPMLAELATALAQAPGAESSLQWIVRE